MKGLVYGNKSDILADISNEKVHVPAIRDGGEPTLLPIPHVD
jgi:hypothetical protein